MEEASRRPAKRVMWGLVPADPNVPNVEAANAEEAKWTIMHMVGMRSWPPGAKVAPLEPLGAATPAATTRVASKRHQAPAPVKEAPPQT